MIETVLRLLLRCPHKNLTRPITPRGPARGSVARTYVACLDCGAALPYDWENMRVSRVAPKAHERPAPELSR